MNKNYILSALSICLFIMLSIFSLYLYYSLGLYEDYLVTICVVMVSLFILCSIFYFSKKIFIYNLGTFIMLLANVILIYNIIDIDSKSGYVSNLVSMKYKYETYELYVQKKNTMYNKINKLEGKKIGILIINQDNVNEYFKMVVNADIIVYDNLDDMEEAIVNGDIQGFVLMDNQSLNDDFSYTVKKIYKCKVKEAM